MNTLPGQPPETASAAAATNSSDPLYQIVAVGENEEKPADTIAALYALYKRSPDVRAVLRLVDPAFMDILTTGASFSSSSSASNNKSTGKEVGAGTRLVRLLTAHVLDGSDEAAEMLADMLDNNRRSAHGATMGLEMLAALGASIMQTILHRVKCGRCPDSGSFARLLSVVTVEPIAATATLEDNNLFSWIPLLIAAIADALIDIGDIATAPETENSVVAKASRLLRLLTFVIEQYHAIDALSALPSLRTLTRRIIAMLSAPMPLVAAPALHAITLLVLGANSAPVAKDSPMCGLSRSLSAKLFDASHMKRTLTLVADFCLNCQEPSSSSPHAVNEAERGAMVADDLLVLEAVSGIIGAIVRNTGTVRERFYQATTIVQAIVHLQELASYDHRYLTPLLSIVSAIVSLSDDNEEFLTSPLIQSLLFHGANGGPSASNNDTATTTTADCIVKEVVDFVTLCFEDSVDMMFPMAMGCKMLELYTERCFPPDQQQQQQQQQQQPMWLCTSYEGSYGWCFNSGQKQQRRISQALVCLLGKLKTVRKSNCTDDQGALWMRRIVDTVVGPHLSRYKDVVGSLKGKASGYRLSRETAERQLVHQLTYIGCHYRIVKPVLALAVDLAYGTAMITAPKDGPENHSSSTGLQALFDWAQTVISSETGEKQPSLHEEVLSLLFANDDHDSGGESSIEQHLLRSAPNAVTPDSAFSSPGSAMHEEAIIDIDDLRKANSKEGRWWLEKGEEVGLGISTDPHCMLLERSRLAQVLLIGYWKRLCDVELAHLLVQLSEANDPATATKGQMPFSANTVGSIRLPPPSLFDCMSAIVDLHRRHMSAKAAAENAFQKAMQSKQAALAGAEDEIAYLSSQLQSAQDQRSELTRQIQRHQETNGEIEQERKRLKTTADELTAAHKQAHADAVEWKEECVATRDLLDKSESSAARTLLDLEQLSETHGRMERKYAREQEMWATKHREMAKSNKELELALANAVARLRDVEAQADLDRSVNEELRRQNAAMAMRLSEFSKLTETLHNLSRIQN